VLRPGSGYPSARSRRFAPDSRPMPRIDACLCCFTPTNLHHPAPACQEPRCVLCCDACDAGSILQGSSCETPQRPPWPTGPASHQDRPPTARAGAGSRARPRARHHRLPRLLGAPTSPRPPPVQILRCPNRRRGPPARWRRTPASAHRGVQAAPRRKGRAEGRAVHRVQIQRGPPGPDVEMGLTPA